MDVGIREQQRVSHSQLGRRSRSLLGLVFFALVSLSCSERTRTLKTLAEPWWQGGPPEDPPQMLNTALPFQYPAAEYLRRLQGDVTMRLFVDAEGHVVVDSTRIEQSSGVVAFDSAALVGATRLRFKPARRQGVAIPVALLFPVHFRHPEVSHPPRDSL